MGWSHYNLRRENKAALYVGVMYNCTNDKDFMSVLTLPLIHDIQDYIHLWFVKNEKKKKNKEYCKSIKTTNMLHQRENSDS